ncbi:MAG: hypothetical protein M0024_05860 [Nitrospiraceae bacterium]|nr:hypothetical protein [Nitrospiraceae bacterium]
MTFKDYLSPLEGQECELLDSDSTGYIVFFGHRTPAKNTHRLTAVHDDFSVFAQKDFPSETAVPHGILRIIKNI